MGRFCSWRLVFFGDKSRLVSRLFFGEKIGIIALSPTFGEAISGETISGSKTNRSKSEHTLKSLAHINVSQINNALYMSNYLKCANEDFLKKTCLIPH